VAAAVAGTAGASDSTGAGGVLVGGTLQAESQLNIKDKTNKIRFMLSPYFGLI
jgi:hypothetical protein